MHFLFLCDWRSGWNAVHNESFRMFRSDEYRTRTAVRVEFTWRLFMRFISSSVLWIMISIYGSCESRKLGMNQRSLKCFQSYNVTIKRTRRWKEMRKIRRWKFCQRENCFSLLHYDTYVFVADCAMISRCEEDLGAGATLTDHVLVIGIDKNETCVVWVASADGWKSRSRCMQVWHAAVERDRE